MSGIAIRGFRTQVTEERISEGVTVDRPLRKVAVGAILKNPFVGGENDTLVEDLSEAVDWSPELGTLLGRMAVEALGEPVLSYGKGGVAGVAGAQEHAVAFITTPFGDALRAAVGGGAAWISSASVVGVAGTPLTIPLAHKDALYVRDHYDAVTLYPGDAPRPDEVVIVIAVANRGRLNARLGGLPADQIEGVDGLR